MLEFDGKIIHIDPWSQADYTGIPQADFILITHTHADSHGQGHHQQTEEAKDDRSRAPAVTTR